MAECWENTLYQLLERTSTDMPGDVEAALRRAAEVEEPGSSASAAVSVMLENIALARQKRAPLCQDTGSLLFWVRAPASLPYATFHHAAKSAIVRATDDGLLRRNCVDPLTGRNSGNNLGRGSPVIHWECAAAAEARVCLILKGGGCENVGAQYALPATTLHAGRDLEGVRRCVLDAVHRAQGCGCAPGVLGVAIGGDRATGYAESKSLFRRALGERNPMPELAELERRLLGEANQLGIGPMGFGGKTALLDVFVSHLYRVPASYFVSISYMCWAYRRRTIRTHADGTLLAWE